ncbi:phosphoribosylamine--glycine ligase [Phototrophicus methaneseepsis]|uniref:Phosphoribosylamine--glycine ligase n=1 Tax=Phototrophicus methaneseepsis TaxID=2710758 RepID=A0A7S8IE46_9CHLR|nr:phosphoribosylamine--glycine ligase [Phototrophicus methaneseepsis]QPC83295.1 phosphoribosylamine--glycine ligase [Phototrophicus methaneseepsis]
MSQTVLVIGGGGREHALAWKLAQSPQVSRVLVAPGNGGTSWAGNDALAPCETVALSEGDFEGLMDLARRENVALTVIGPEVPLAAGIVDVFSREGLRTFGPSQAAAQLEASKAYARDFMAEHDIPTPAYATFADAIAAKTYITEQDRPLVVKADGLAAGKGVLICQTAQEAHDAVDEIMAARAFGDAGAQIVIEDCMVGDEFSVLAFCDGVTVRPMMVARDHKRALDGDRGLNTGGMGAYAPTTDLSEEDIQTIVETVLQPTLDGMRAQDTPYIGVLYAGLMRTDAGFKVLEFNCRFGDPETQVVLPMLDGDLYTIMNACIDGTLADAAINWFGGTCATVILASPGYPGAYPKGLPIEVDTLSPGTLLFHAGTKRTEQGDLVTSGGRVLAVTARAATLNGALMQVYSDIEQIHFEKKHFRTDIGRRHA